MHSRGIARASLLCGVVVLAAVGGVRRAQAWSEPPDAPLTAILVRLGDAVRGYYARAEQVVCDELVVLQPVGEDRLSGDAPARRLQFELRIGWGSNDSTDADSPHDATVWRTLQRVNGRPPRASDLDHCMDPKAASPDPLRIFLAEHQSDYRFTRPTRTTVDGRRAVRLDYQPREAGPVSAMRHDDCVSIVLPGRTAGRVWVDEDTGGVLRHDEYLVGLHDVRIPMGARRGPFEVDRVIVERLDSSTRYRPVHFSDPDETLLLPASMESFTVIRQAGVPRLRTTQRFSRYRRFLTAGRVVE